MPKIKVIRPTEEIKKELAELEENIRQQPHPSRR